MIKSYAAIGKHPSSSQTKTLDAYNFCKSSRSMIAVQTVLLAVFFLFLSMSVMVRDASHGFLMCFSHFTFHHHRVNKSYRDPFVPLIWPW